MLRLIQVGGGLPISHIVDPSSVFQPGMIAQRKNFGNQVVTGVSDGTCPYGILDDIKTQAFTTTKIDEIVRLTIPPQAFDPVTSELIIPMSTYLEESNILVGEGGDQWTSFTSTLDVALTAKNGVIEFQPGTKLNLDLDGDGKLDTIETKVSYSYRIPSIPGDDSTIGSGHVTVWVFRGLYATDQFDTSAQYPINAPLFVSQQGKLTTRQAAEGYPAAAMVIDPPSSIGNGALTFLWF